MTEQELECCSNCGDLVPYLDDFTGWCPECSGTPISSSTGSWYVKWLTLNGDEIERVMVTQRVTAVVAKKVVALANRPICVCCKKPIKRGNPRSVFCTTTPECKTAQAIFNSCSRTLQREQAILRTLEEMLIRKLLAA